MIARENWALSEGIRDRCQRTGTAPGLWIARQIQFPNKLLLNYPFTVLWLRALMHPPAADAAFAGDYSWSGSIEKKLPYAP